MARTKRPKASEAKAKVASERPRVGGRFVSLDPEKADKLKKQAEDIELALAGSENPDVITEEARAYFGTDSQKFFELALQNSTTWFDGYKYAKELKNLQHPTLSAVQSKQEVEVTTRRLVWDWESDPTVIAASFADDAVIEVGLANVPAIESTEESTSED
jgi:hypothetical protein